MKKFCAVFALLCVMFLFAACGGDGTTKIVNDQNSDDSSSETNDSDSDPSSQDSENQNDEEISDSTDNSDGETDTTPDDADPTDDNADSGDDEDFIDPDVTDTGETVGETRVADCTGLPENASWNTVSAIVQTWNGEKWVPSSVASFNLEGSEEDCRFKCDTNYGWNGSSCSSGGGSSTTPCDPNPCLSVANSTHDCSVFGGTNYKCECNSDYYWDGTICGTVQTQTAVCTGLIPGAEWNTASEIIQKWDDYLGTWVPTANGSYNENPSTNQCRYKCKENYFWSDSKCVSPCDPNPCGSDQNSTGECSATSLTDFSCGCKTGSTWNESESQCMVDPANIPECSSTSATPCRDSSSGLTWSPKASSTMTWSSAKSYCESYSEGGLSGWHLPTISELRTLIQNCPATVTGGECGVTDSCLSWYECRNDACSGCSSDSTGKYSKLGDTGYFWSSSVISDISQVWNVYFSYGVVINDGSSTTHSVRCVR